MASKITAVQDEQTLAGADIVQPLTSRSLFWQANYLTGGRATDMLSFLFWCVESTAPRVLVSLSRSSGESYFAMCQTVERLSLDTRCFNVASKTPGKAMRAHNADNFEDFSILMEDDPAEAVTRFADHSIDLLYLDLAHLPGDLTLWKDKLSSRGVLLLHGIRTPELAQAGATCLDQLGLKSVDFTLEHGAGMGVVLNPDAPVRLTRLAQMDLGQPGYGEVQKVFFRLGKAQKNAHLARDAADKQNQLNADIAQLRKQVEQAQADVDTATRKTAKLRQAYEARNQHTAVLEARHFDTVTALQERTDTLQSTCDEHTRNTADLTARLAEADAQIERATARAERAQSSLEQIQAGRDETHAKITRQSDQITELTAQLDDLARQNTDWAAQVAALEEQTRHPQFTPEEQARVDALADTNARQTRELAALVKGFEEVRAAYESKLEWLRNKLAATEKAAGKTAEENQQIIQALNEEKTQLSIETDRLNAEQTAATTEHEARIQLLNSAMSELNGQIDLQTDELATLTEMLETRTEEKTQLSIEIDRLSEEQTAATAEHEARTQLLNNAMSELKGQIDLQTDELATLTEMLEKKDRQHLAQHEWQEVKIELRDAEIAVLRGAGGRLRRGDAPSRAGLPSLKKQIQILKESDLFDADWYLRTYTDVAQSGTDPAHHYVVHGALDGRNPGPGFDTMGYYLANRDVAQRGFNALVHYLMFGRDEKRKLSKAPG